MHESLTERLESILGVTPASIQPLSGGSVGEVYRVTLPDNTTVVVKVDQGSTPRLDNEGYMLRYLREHSALPVPAVIHGSPELLVIEWVDGESHFNQAAEKHAAVLLADLHGIQQPTFGLEKDTLIGSLHQPNNASDSWIDFFAEHRLLHMAGMAYQEKAMSLETLHRVERFASQLGRWLQEPDHPSLLHGDVWTTNILAQDDRITAFVDPAVYYGHPEIELAFITLFSTFGNQFFDHYHELRPIASDFFEIRKDIYNLYPLLVHVRLFGGGYLRNVESILARFGV